MITLMLKTIKPCFLSSSVPLIVRISLTLSSYYRHSSFEGNAIHRDQAVIGIRMSTAAAFFSYAASRVTLFWVLLLRLRPPYIGRCFLYGPSAGRLMSLLLLLSVVFFCRLAKSDSFCRIMKLNASYSLLFLSPSY